MPVSYSLTKPNRTQNTLLYSQNTPVLPMPITKTPFLVFFHTPPKSTHTESHRRSAMDDAVPTSELPNQSSGASDSSSSHPELQFDGFHAGNGADSAPKAASFGGGMGREVAGSNAARYRLLSPARLPISRSPCLTIPPGLSPTALLDSPVLLSGVKVWLFLGPLLSISFEQTFLLLFFLSCLS